MKSSIFGTDGVRGTANRYPVTAEVALQIGKAVAYVFKQNHPQPQIVIGKDTRLSGYMLESAIASGITSMGVNIALLGPMPTPAVAHLTRTLRAAAGVVISASHNPFEDNGIKIFQGNGYKCEDALEAKIESLLFSETLEKAAPSGDKIGRAVRIDKADARYSEMAKASFPTDLNLFGMKIALDCANGAAYKTSPEVLTELGASVTVLHNQPNGLNINEKCGSTYPEVVAAAVKQIGANIGISHDGDADRVILCDEKGEIVDGDEVLAILALNMLRQGKLAQKTLVSTVMSNFGLDETLEEAGGKVIRTGVGDRYVIEAMIEKNLNLGGEQSGHVIVRDHVTTGDGLITALQILRIMRETGTPLSELKKCLKKYPQRLINLKVKEKRSFESVAGLNETILAVEKEMAGKGRVLLRYSGTEPKIRLLLEAREEGKIDSWAERILDPIRKELVVA
ncbi:MAG: phosphoglucosamine mutase [Verrucomicrobiota bacterium]